MYSFIVTLSCGVYRFVFFFFFNDTATTEIYTLSLHDALPISAMCGGAAVFSDQTRYLAEAFADGREIVTFAWPKMADRKSTRLNSSHANISYAVFCLKKKKKKKKCITIT